MEKPPLTDLWVVVRSHDDEPLFEGSFDECLDYYTEWEAYEDTYIMNAHWI